jgi:hypothetical protein
MIIQGRLNNNIYKMSVCWNMNQETDSLEEIDYKTHH